MVSVQVVHACWEVVVRGYSSSSEQEVDEISTSLPEVEIGGIAGVVVIVGGCSVGVVSVEVVHVVETTSVAV